MTTSHALPYIARCDESLRGKTGIDGSRIRLLPKPDHEERPVIVTPRCPPRASCGSYCFNPSLLRDAHPHLQIDPLGFKRQALLKLSLGIFPTVHQQDCFGWQVHFEHKT